MEEKIGLKKEGVMKGTKLYHAVYELWRNKR